jgi:hypothetical protein
LTLSALCGAAPFGALADSPGTPIHISVQPNPVYVENANGTQLINCDFVVTNTSRIAWTVREIEMTAYDAGGKPETRRIIGDNGNSPGIETLNKRVVRAGQRILIFNPLFSFDDDIRLARISYRFHWLADRGEREIEVEVSVRPEAYAPVATLHLPIGGRAIIWDGHDYYSHHRRFDYMSRRSQADGTRSNIDRYAYDFVPVNEAGEMRNGPPEVNASWFGFGQRINAAGAGRVVAVVDDGMDNREVDTARFEANRLADYGNYIVIDHGGGEFALYGHIMHASAQVRPGDDVKPGQPIAAIGASGSSLMPHLHFQLQSTADADGEGLPSYFGGFFRVLGDRSLPVPTGQIDSGDIVEDAPDFAMARGTDPCCT